MSRGVLQQLERILAGDESAAAWLFDTFAPRLYRRLGQRYGFPGGLETDDLLQDAFVFFFQNDRRVLRNFLARVPADQVDELRIERFLWDQACGLATNRRRSTALRKVVSIDRDRDIPRDPEAERTTVDRDTLRRLIRCLENRSARVLLYFNLRYRDGLTPEEVAQTTGWSRKATYKLKQKLTEALERCGEELSISTS